MSERTARIRCVVEVLSALGVRHALIGGHAVSFHARPRVTVDVEFLVTGKGLDAIAEALRQRGFIAEQRGEVLRAWDAGSDPERDEPVVDLVPAQLNRTQAEALRTAVDVDYAGVALSMVTRPALVALKYRSATRTTRAHGDRLQDAADMSHLVTRDWTPEDTQTAAALVGLSAPGAVRELEQLVDDLQHGRPITL